MGTGLSSELIHSLLKSLLRPIVRFCLRNSASFQDLTSAAREVFVEEAQVELATEARVNISRISVLTGLQRHEINRLLDPENGPKIGPKSVFSRVIAHWQSDKRFCGKDGRPRPLRISGRKPEFRHLVESITTALSYSTVLLELKRRGLVEQSEDKVTLLVEMYPFEGDLQGGYELLSRDIDSLMAAAEHNLRRAEELPNLHIRTEFDNLSVRHIPEIKEWLINEGREFHLRARDYIARYDKDLNPAMAHEPGRGFLAFGSFSVTRNE